VREFKDYAGALRQELLLKRQKGGDGFYNLTGLDRAKFCALGKRSG